MFLLLALWLGNAIPGVESPIATPWENSAEYFSPRPVDEVVCAARAQTVAKVSTGVETAVSREFGSCHVEIVAAEAATGIPIDGTDFVVIWEETE